MQAIVYNDANKQFCSSYVLSNLVFVLVSYQQKLFSPLFLFFHVEMQVSYLASSQCDWSLEFAANNARNRYINGHAVIYEHLNCALLVLCEFTLDNLHVVLVALSLCIGFHLLSPLLVIIKNVQVSIKSLKNGRRARDLYSLAIVSSCINMAHLPGQS